MVGSIFYVMERRRGIVVRHEEPPALVDQPARRRQVSEAMVDTLASLHAVDITEPSLAALGKPAGFVERQVRGWTERWHRSKIAEVPDMEQVADWLVAHLPPDPVRPAIVHGDFKLDNVLLDSTDIAHIVAVFDWEMSALGDPLVDLGILLAYWAPTAPPSQRDALTTVTHRPGWLTHDEIVDRYAAKSGRDVSNISFYEIFALFKIAVVIQQIFYRYSRGQTDDARFATFGDRVLVSRAPGSGARDERLKLRIRNSGIGNSYNGGGAVGEREAALGRGGGARAAGAERSAGRSARGGRVSLGPASGAG